MYTPLNHSNAAYNHIHYTKADFLNLTIWKHARCFHDKNKARIYLPLLLLLFTKSQALSAVHMNGGELLYPCMT